MTPYQIFSQILVIKVQHEGKLKFFTTSWTPYPAFLEKYMIANPPGF